MPLIKNKIKFTKGHLLIWRLDETAERLLETLPDWLNLQEYEQISHPLKKREWLAGRHLFVSLCNEAGLTFQGIWKNPQGKPFLIGSDAHISLSHSEHYVIAALHYDSPVGIDIERPRDTLLRVAGKFLNPEEIRHATSDLPTLCQYWSVKEATYKLFGERRISFRQHIRVSPSATAGHWFVRVESPMLAGDAMVETHEEHGHFIAIALGFHPDQRIKAVAGG